MDLSESVFSRFDRRGLNAALLSFLPGLGHLYIGRKDKALAFFLVDLVNIALLYFISGSWLRFLNYRSEGFAAVYWLDLHSYFQFSSLPAICICLLIFAYLIYAQIDAYKEALKPACPATASLSPFIAPACRLPSFMYGLDLGLSQTTSASYVVHTSAILSLFFLFAFKIIPSVLECRERPQITLEFEFEQSAADQKARGENGSPGEESKIANERQARLKDPQRKQVNASSPSSEQSCSLNASGNKEELAARETEAIASKQLLSSSSFMSPREVTSKGRLPEASRIARAENHELEKSSNSQPSSFTESQAVTKASTSQDTVQVRYSEIFQNSQIAEIENNASNNSGLAKLRSRSRLLAQLPSAAAASRSLNDPGQSRSRPSKSSALEPASIPANAACLAEVPKTASAASAAPLLPYAGLETSTVSKSEDNPSNGSSASMLGFMDAAFTDDDSMRAFWAEYSGNLSRYLKTHALEGEGSLDCSFNIDESGKPYRIEFNEEAAGSLLAESIKATINANETSVAAPKKFSKQIFMELKVSKDSKNTFVSVEINSHYQPPTKESLNDFRYQTDLQAYLKGIKKAVYSSWKPPVQEGLKPVMLGFKVSTEGRITDQHLVQSSGDPLQDQAALNAARSLSRWSQPPAGTQEDLDVCLVLQKCKSCDEVEASSKPEKSKSQRSSIEPLALY